MSFSPNQENLVQKTRTKSVFFYCDSTGSPIFKSKEIFSDKRIIFYPFNVNLSTQQVKAKRLKCIEFRGWERIQDLPKVIKPYPYGLKFESSTQIENLLSKKFPLLDKVIVSKQGKSRFSQKTISFGWNDLAELIKRL